MVKEGKESDWPWEALGAGLGSVVLFFLLTLRFRLPPLIGLGASLALSSLVFLGVLRLRKMITARPGYKPFHLEEEIQSVALRQEEIKNLIPLANSSLKTPLEDLHSALDKLAQTLSNDPEPEVQASFLKVHQATALRLARIAAGTDLPEHRSRIESATRQVTDRCLDRLERIKENTLLDMEAELEALEETLK